MIRIGTEECTRVESASALSLFDDMPSMNGRERAAGQTWPSGAGSLLSRRCNANGLTSNEGIPKPRFEVIARGARSSAHGCDVDSSELRQDSEIPVLLSKLTKFTAHLTSLTSDWVGSEGRTWFPSGVSTVDEIQGWGK